MHLIWVFHHLTFSSKFSLLQIEAISLLLSKSLDQDQKYLREAAAAALSEFVRYRYSFIYLQKSYAIFISVNLRVNLCCFIQTSTWIIYEARFDCNRPLENTSSAWSLPDLNEKTVSYRAVQPSPAQASTVQLEHSAAEEKPIVLFNINLHTNFCLKILLFLFHHKIWKPLKVAFCPSKITLQKLPQYESAEQTISQANDKRSNFWFKSKP